jgi:hypothetical protein
MKLIKWLFWKIVYLVQPKPRDLEKGFVWLERTRYPYRKFKPLIRWNEDGKQWHIHFTNDSYVTRTGTITGHLHVNREDGSIVGFTISDSYRFNS